MTDPRLLLTVVAISAPWLAAIVASITARKARVVGFSASLVSLAASALLLSATSAGESLNAALMVLFSSLTVGAILVLPRRDCSSGIIGGIQFLLGSTLLGYSTDNLLVLLAAWILTIIPFYLPRLFRALWRPRVSLLISTIALAVAVSGIAASGHSLAIHQLRGQNSGGTAAFALLIIAVIFRKGVCPAHAWVADAIEGGPVIPSALLLNGHFGALLVAKIIVPLFPDTVRTFFPVLSDLALVTALYVAIRSLSENAPRRLLAFLALSQSACILAGLESRTEEGITGALVHWIVVSVSTMGLFGVLRLLEVRFGENLTASTHLGLAEHAPRLAVFFLVFGLALVGLPGTLSFCSQDLLIHGTLKSHPQTGLLLPIAIALNAVSFFRLFTRLFLGKRRTGFTVIADALPREQWILAAGVLFVVLGGLFPSAIVAQRFAEAETARQASLAPLHLTRTQH
ncbi:MAG TPA: proton-conducting transporter membrane subunit [Bryobacteraceae bacterium]|jgi:NADH-quinone oxidoreductase subunit M|nr:proton-conducting transporter membrane subunit [Bryobacteraceae bacterium]